MGNVESKVNPQTFIDMEEKYGARNYHPLGIVLNKGEGVWVYDVAGDKYLDCLSAYSAVNQGHCHPRLVEVIRDQAAKLTLTSRAFRNDQLGPFCQEICELTGYEMVLPMNSGAEGVETAIKASRKWGYLHKNIPENQAEIITFHNNFHGRTTSIISFSSEDSYRKGFGPFTPGFVMVPFGDIKAIAEAITDNTVAVLIEPIQGEGGINIPPEGYLQDVHKLCRENNILMIDDEIQTGLGRTGKLFACDYENIRPDMMILGKALSGGCYPVSIVVSTKEILGVIGPGEHGSTYGGNPLGMAVAREAVKVLIEENMVENAENMGKYFMDKLKQLKNPHIREIRGKGLFIGIELYPEAGGARRYCEALAKEKILCKETHDHILRFAPPLVINKEEIDWAYERIAKVFEKL